MSKKEQQKQQMSAPILSNDIQTLVGDNEKLKNQILAMEAKYAERFRLVGVITDQTLYLLTIEMQMLFQHHGIYARLIANKVGDEGVVIKLAPREQTNIFARKEKNKNI